jgi:Transglutaminase-like superfamily
MEPRTEHNGGGAPPRSFAQLAAGPCPPFDDVLLALSMELGSVDCATARGELDEHARGLFGIERLSAAARVQRLAAVLDEAEFRPVDGQGDPHAFLLEHVLACRRGHPALLAVVARELARRAGVDVGVFSSPSGWYVGCADGDHLALIALGGATVDITPPGVRRHCAHEVAFAVLCGLQYSLCSSGQHDAAAHMAALRDHLPVTRFAGGDVETA